MFGVGLGVVESESRDGRLCFGNMVRQGRLFCLVLLVGSKNGTVLYKTVAWIIRLCDWRDRCKTLE